MKTKIVVFQLYGRDELQILNKEHLTPKSSTLYKWWHRYILFWFLYAPGMQQEQVRN